MGTSLAEDPAIEFALELVAVKLALTFGRPTDRDPVGSEVSQVRPEAGIDVAF
jgi:hypothetical protein